MGYMRHHAIVVTSWDKDLLARAHDKATDLGMAVSNIVAGTTNGYRSFFVGPDGSKEGWGDSDVGDAQRETLLDWLDAQRHDDDSSNLAWAEVQFGDGEFDSRIVRDSDEHARGRYRRQATSFEPGQLVTILDNDEHAGQIATVNGVQHDGKVVVYFSDQDEEEWVYDPFELEPTSAPGQSLLERCAARALVEHATTDRQLEAILRDELAKQRAVRPLN